jgi:ubiquinone/menaquinone biosynthesis C-methylase UbiE
VDSDKGFRLNGIMAKTQRELAFLRDLYINDDWTRRFTELADKHLDMGDAENLLYLNAGTGNHCFEIKEKAGDDLAIFAACEDEDLLAIAQDKALALKADVDISMIRFDDNAFDAVIADASLVRPRNLADLIDDTARVAKTGASVMVVVPTAGSFGEIFSLMWEVLFKEDMGEHGAAVEALIAELPTAARLEEMAEKAGLADIKTETANEVFEYDDGAAFIASPLVVDFLLPEWLSSLTDGEKERVTKTLAQLIDEEDGKLTFRFSVKATVLTGEKD